MNCAAVLNVSRRGSDSLRSGLGGRRGGLRFASTPRLKLLGRDLIRSVAHNRNLRRWGYGFRSRNLVVPEKVRFSQSFTGDPN